MPIVVYVVGKGRSGSTLLDRLLGRSDGVVSTGELSRLWEWHVVDGYPCACGRHVRHCELWGSVLDRIGIRPADGRRLAELTRWVLSWSRVPRLLGPDARRDPRVRRYVTVTTDLYAAIAEVTGGRVVVDSTKWPAHPGLLGLVDGTEPRGIHLTRDPRAVSFSYLRRKPTAGRQPPMPRFPASHSAASWLARNALVEIVQRRTAAPIRHVRYEDLAVRPSETLESLRGLIGGDVDLGLDGAGSTDGHLLGGNPDRFARGPLEVRPDHEWRRGLRDRDALTVTAVAGPLMGRYGYRLRRD